MLPTEDDLDLIPLYLLASETPGLVSRSELRQDLIAWFQVSEAEEQEVSPFGNNLLSKRLDFHLSSLGGERSGGQFAYHIKGTDEWGITEMGLKYLFNNLTSNRKNIAQNSPGYAQSSHHRLLDYVDVPATVLVKLGHTQRLNLFRKELQNRKQGKVNFRWDARFKPLTLGTPVTTVNDEDVVVSSKTRAALEIALKIA